MRSVVLAVLAVIGIVVSLRMHVADRHHRLGREILERGDDPAGAAARIERAYETDQGDALYALRIGLAKLRTGIREDLEEAIVWFRVAARRNPLMARAQFWWGVALVSLDREDEALVRFETARRLTPYNVDLNRRIAGYYMERWERTRSTADLGRAFEAFHALRLVEPEVTSEAVERLLSHPLVSYADLDGVIPRDAAQRETLAETLAMARRYAWSIRAFDEADELAGARGSLKVRGRILYFRHLAGEHPVAALEVIEEARRVALAEGAETFTHELDLALAYLRAAVADGVEESDRAAATDEALAALKRHFGRSPRNVESTIGEIADALRLLSPDEVGSLDLVFWRWVRASHKTLEAAAADLHLAEANLDDAGGTGSVDEALDVLKRYSRVNPPSARASYLYALCYRRVGRLDLASKHLQKALQLRPDAQEYQELARELDGGDEK